MFYALASITDRPSHIPSLNWVTLCKLSEAFNRIGRFKRFVIRSIGRGLGFIRDRIVQCFRTQISFRRGE